MSTAPDLTRFRTEYAAHRASEGRRYDRAELLALPYLRQGAHADQWAVRARTFDAFLRHTLEPMRRTAPRPLRLLDLGAGNGWLSWRVSSLGVQATALDIRDDTIDGLGAASAYLEGDAHRFARVVASFHAMPLCSGSFDVTVFNASLHYATDLTGVLAEALRVTRAGGKIAVLDSPFYTSEEDGCAMIEEKMRSATRTFGERAEVLTSIPFVEFLTRERLERASRGLALRWTRRAVRYPLWYELRPWRARLASLRAPSRFDVWEGVRA